MFHLKQLLNVCGEGGRGFTRYLHRMNEKGDDINEILSATFGVYLSRCLQFTLVVCKLVDEG